MIEIRGLRKAFGTKVVLNGVDLVIPNGKTTCVIGRSGCGKSVLLKHIVGLLTADNGTVQIDGHDVSKLSKREMFSLRRRIGYGFQGAALFDSLTVYENVVIGLVEHGERNEELLQAEGRRVLSAVGLVPDPSTTSPEVFEREFASLASKKPSDLSGGMKKRVGVARALVGKPSYIFYDEPTTGLDPITSLEIISLINKIQEKYQTSSMIISHDMKCVKLVANRIAMLIDGKCYAVGTYDELSASNDEKIRQFFN